MLKVGILGGGQLGRMLLQAVANYHVETYVLENDEFCPAAHLCHHFVKGNITDYNTVYHFGKSLDAITIEIENVNLDALDKLEAEGVKVYPKPAVLRIIKNKIFQKKFYAEHEIPTPDFVITNDLAELQDHLSFLPAVHKIAEGGYDGRGVKVLINADEIENGFCDPAILEKQVQIKREIAQIIAVAQDGKIVLYPPVEMVFNKDLNLLDYQICPAGITEPILWKVEAVAMKVVKNFNSPGLFAVELFLDRDDNVWVNETAPRVHNSGHHTIDAHYCSQFDMLWRIILNYPLGNTNAMFPSVMVNILGNKELTGRPEYENINQLLKIENSFLHLYGKREIKPGRKMGHITIVSADSHDLVHKANKVKQILTTD
jgi:5-(carboxyamino)imidazole ribonucleotide synthase